jgi:tRNA A-37 threonylcarbamoyl transferase component Bud32
MIPQQIPHDAALPHLQFALDPERMRAALAPHLATPHVRVEGCRIERVRYKPGRSCLLAYALELGVEGRAGTSEQVLCARMYPPNESASRYAKAARAPLATPRYGAPLFHLPELDMIVWAFPNERKLAGLPHLTDDARLRERALPAIVARLHGPDWQLEHAAHRVVHYVPEHTCTVRAVLGVRRRDGMRQRSVAYGKAYYDDHGRLVGEAMRQLWQSRAVQSGGLGIARPILYDERERVLWQEGLEGDTLEQRHADDRIPAETLRQVACAIAALHASPVAGLPRARSDALLAELTMRARVIGDARPALRPLLEQLVARLGTTPPAIAPLVTLHGDLHPKNVLLIGERVWLIDLDGIRRGAAEEDLGSWIACMLYRACLRGDGIGRVEHAAAELVAHYEAARNARLNARALDWHVAVALVRERAFRVLSRLKPGRLELLDDLLALALEACGCTSRLAAERRRA